MLYRNLAVLEAGLTHPNATALSKTNIIAGHDHLQHPGPLKKRFPVFTCIQCKAKVRA